MASSPAIVVCTACYMYSLSVAVGDEGFTCDKCREIVRLTEKILELETRIQTLVEDSKNVRAVDTALDATSSGTPVHCSVPVEPVQQGNWVTVRRPSRGSKHRSSAGGIWMIADLFFSSFLSPPGILFIFYSIQLSPCW